MSAPVASAVVRTFNSMATVAATFASLRAQDVPVEVVVVDSGSTDGTLELAAREADQVVRLSPQEFTFGHALNVGAEAASAPVHIGLSSHCVLPGPWYARVAAGHVADGAQGAFGEVRDWQGQPLEGPRRVSYDDLVQDRFWGYSGHGGTWSAAAWRREPFRADLPSSEDREWSWRVVQDGGYLVVDPRLLVDAGHRRDAGVRSYYRRMVKEGTALLEWRPLEPYSARAAVRDLLHPAPGTQMITRSRRLGRTRAVEVAAKVAADRRQRALRRQGRQRPS
ncbi:glycosyltransferase [Pseudokineococcus sp. 1T1Z-3]|uniref:glycosyltransferase n=1 Tax=Pseudokineococcus sp. 1T1Z-3 TaxID=3132745 RepID=UPI00309CF24E